MGSMREEKSGSKGETRCSGSPLRSKRDSRNVSEGRREKEVTGLSSSSTFPPSLSSSAIRLTSMVFLNPSALEEKGSMKKTRLGSENGQMKDGWGRGRTILEGEEEVEGGGGGGRASSSC